MPWCTPSEGFIRRLRPRDIGLLHRHLLRLSPAERRLRFCGTASDTFIRFYCEDPHRYRSVLVGYFVQGEMRGAGEMVLPGAPLWGQSAEAALSVECACQRRGVGRALLRRLMVLARNRGAGTLRMICLRENLAMQHMAAGMGAGMTVQVGGDEGRPGPAWSTCLSLAEEAALDGCGVLDLVLGLGGPAPDEASGDPRAALEAAP